ncbi:MAG: polysaccharide biosynthesis protein [Rhodospirillales bacterium]|nr:polysaccharide biosynthesis protein [Rhodospirillales bacterium]
MYPLAFTPAGAKRLLQFAHDGVFIVLSLPLALILLAGFEGLRDFEQLVTVGVPVFTVIAVAFYIHFGLHRSLWRFTSVADLQAIVGSVACSVLAFAVLMHLGVGLEVPPSALFIQFLCLVALLAGSRCVRRVIRDNMAGGLAGSRFARKADPMPLLLVGSPQSAELTIRACRHQQAAETSYQVIGIVDLADGDVGRGVMNVPILGSIACLPQILQSLERKGQRPQRIVLTSQMQGQPLRELQTVAERAKIILCRLPKPTEFREAGGDGGLDLRPIAVEDLLTRPQVKLERQAIEGLIEHRRVLVTGAGGSIGSELCRQIASCNPAQLVLLDQCEYNLYAIDMEMAKTFPQLDRHAILLDIRDGAALERTFHDARPDLVFHTAALKHVPLVEHNPIEGVLTNVFGTRNVAQAARRVGAIAFVQVSTDKAVSPTNVMGATKRLAECYCQALDLAGRDSGGSTYFKTVRFGNVMGSSGSVIPLFQQQLREGGPITVTHREITRYFMTIREASGLVLQALAGGLRRGAHRGEIYVLDMGTPVRILDVARQMIRLSGLSDVPIRFVGLRPGEKLYEELFDDREERVESGIAGVLMAHSTPLATATIEDALEDLELACAAADKAAVIRLLARYVPGYTPSAPVSALAPVVPLARVNGESHAAASHRPQRHNRRGGRGPVVRVLDA